MALVLPMNSPLWPRGGPVHKPSVAAVGLQYVSKLRSIFLNSLHAPLLGFGSGSDAREGVSACAKFTENAGVAVPRDGRALTDMGSVPNGGSIVAIAGRRSDKLGHAARFANASLGDKGSKDRPCVMSAAKVLIACSTSLKSCDSLIANCSVLP